MTWLALKCSKIYNISIIIFFVGFAADVGALQRLPKVIGSESLVRELCLTARKFYSDEAFQCGLVSRVLPDKTS